MRVQGNQAVRTLALSFALLFMVTAVEAQSVDADAGPLVVEEASGAAKIKLANRWQSPSAGMIVTLPATVSTGPDGSVRLRQDETVISIAANTAIDLIAEPESGAPLQRVVQDKGSAFYDIAPRVRSRLRVETPWLVAVIKGTEFNVTVAAETSTVALFEGRLQIEAPDVGDIIDLRQGQIAKRHKDDPGITVLPMDGTEAVPERGASPESRDPDDTAGGSLVRRDDTLLDVPLQTTIDLGAGVGELGAGLDVDEALDMEGASADLAMDPGVDLGDAVVDSGLDAGVDLGDVVVDVDLDAGVDLGDVVVDVELDAGVDLGDVVVDVELDAGVGAGDIELGIDSDVGIGEIAAGLDLDVGADLNGGTIDLGLDSGIDAGDTAVDLGADVAVDLGQGELDLGLTGAVDVGGDVLVDAGIDAGLDTGDSGISLDTGLDAGLGLSDTSLDADLDTGIDLGGGEVAADLDTGAGITVAGVDVGLDIGADLDLGNLEDLDVALGLDLDLPGEDDEDDNVEEDEDVSLPINPRELLDLLSL